MKAVIQRVSRASVTVDKSTVGKIENGFLILLGVFDNDTEEDCELLARKVSALRIFSDREDRLNLSLLDISGEVLVISNFTLCADTSHGNRPSFINAAGSAKALPLYNLFCKCLEKNGIKKVETGIFGADMKVDLLNDGPITVILDTNDWRKKK